MRGPTIALAARGLAKSYSAGIRGCSARVAALRGVDLDVPRGVAVGVLGPPGSGKTTLLLCLAGLLRPEAGTVRWFGRPPDESGPPAGLAYVPERSAAYGFMTVRETVEYHAILHDLASHDRGDAVAEALARTGLAPLADASVGSLPLHALERLGVARALVGRPRVLLLDETLTALDPPMRREIAAALRTLVDDGTTAVLAGCDLGALEMVVSRIAVMLDGRIVALTAPSALRRARAIEVTVTPAGGTEPPPAEGLRAVTRVAEPARPPQVLRIPLENTTPEAVLARCQACGLRVERSRIILADET
jgi:ABC-type multidrug transport system ATPase subunit